ncbi:YdcF family protein [Nonomuraea glycinis]|uniref:ElyC/SanA/YdcF family protein n=1 Tax=Nonomuraea glycinis TaxID=2047744 RepID=UPI001CD9B4B8|nr:ElyC/SanA/YdcF family protein [Nonomuraea glycinis]MCA2177551.1 YdcF family protein [Nonomuraea glycinis]
MNHRPRNPHSPAVPGASVEHAGAGRNPAEAREAALEDRSATTWENITNVIPLLENADRIKIVSQPAHALKARAYLRRQRPDLAERLVRADDYRPGEWMAVKPLLALYGLWTLRGLKADERKISL